MTKPIPFQAHAMRRSLRLEVWLAAMRDRDGCWEWTGSCTPDGYGQVMVDRRQYRVHRLMYAWHVGALVDGLQVDHTCHNRKCANPNHLEQVTPRENTLRGDTPARRNAERTHCNRGHALTPDNLYFRDGERRRIRRCRACEIDKQSRRNKDQRERFSARRMERYRNDPEYRERAKAIQRNYHARKRTA